MAKIKAEKTAPTASTSSPALSDDVKKAYDLIDQHIMIINRDFVIEFCNLKVLEDMGDVTGRYCYEAFCRSGAPPEDCPLKRVLNTGSPNSRVINHRGLSVYATVRPFSVDKRGVSLFLHITRNITPLMMVKNDRKESREVFEELFNSISEPITIHAPDYTILDANIAALTLLGLKKEDVIGRKCYEIFHHTDSPISACPLRQTLLKGDMESALVGPPYLKGHYMVNTAPIFGKDGEIVRVIHLLKDVTELKEMERKLTRDNERLMMFSDLITHDMGNYSQGALLAIDMLLADDTLSPRQRRYLEMARAQMQSASQLLENARKLSRLYERRVKPVPVDAGIILMKAISQLKKTYARREIRVNTEVKMGTHTVLADDLLFDVFLNIMGNSVKYTISDPVVVDVVADVWDEDPSFYRFEIIDRAGGIPDEYKEGIFNRFERFSKRASGSGLGLTLVKKIVMNYGGNLWVEDFKVDGEVVGSVFVVLLKRG